MADCVDVPIKVDAKYDILDDFAKKVEAENPHNYYVTVSSLLNVKNLSDVANLRDRVNMELNKLILKLPSLKDSIEANF